MREERFLFSGPLFLDTPIPLQLRILGLHTPGAAGLGVGMQALYLPATATVPSDSDPEDSAMRTEWLEKGSTPQRRAGMLREGCVSSPRAKEAV